MLFMHTHIRMKQSMFPDRDSHINSIHIRFISRWCQWNFSLTLSFRWHYGPGVDSASNRYEDQECFLGVNAAGT